MPADPAGIDDARPPLRSCGCALIAGATLLFSGSWIVGGVLGDCFDDCSGKTPQALFGLPALVLLAGAVLGYAFLRATRRR